MIKKVKKILKNIIIFLFIMILVYLCYVKIVNKSPFVKIFNFGILNVSSGSMSPELEIGEIIIILDTKSYKVGDIVTFYEKGSNLITHRIISENELGFITKGDFNNVQDENILTKENIQGKVVFHSKLLGILLRYYIIFILVLIFLLFIKI